MRLLLLKAIIPGGAAGDLFAATVQVKPHTANGRQVKGYTAVRHKAPERPDSTQASTPASEPRLVLPTPSTRDPLLDGLPEDAEFRSGGGPIKDHWSVRWKPPLPTMYGNTNYFPTKEEAARQAREWVANQYQVAAKMAADKKRDLEIRDKLLAGGEPDDSDLKHLGLRPGKNSGYSYLVDAVRRVFGLKNHEIKKSMGDALFTTHSDMGTPHVYGRPRHALMNAAAWVRERAAKPPRLVLPTKPAEKAFGADAHDMARSLIEKGRETGNESATLFDPNTNGIEHLNTGGPHSVAFTEAMVRALSNPDNAFVAQHNHPSSSSLSRDDIGTLANPGMSHIVAHGHDGTFYAARLGDGIPKVVHDRGDGAIHHWLTTVFDEVHRSIWKSYAKALEDKKADVASINAAFNDTIMRILHDKGAIDYKTSFKPSASVANIAPSVLAEAGVRDAGTAYNRPSFSVRPDEGLAAVLGEARETAARKRAGKARQGGPGEDDRGSAQAPAVSRAAA